MMRDNWQWLVDTTKVRKDYAETLDILEDLNPLVYDGGEIPEETINSGILSLEALLGWLEECEQSGVITEHEHYRLRDVIRLSHESKWGYQNHEKRHQ